MKNKEENKHKFIFPNIMANAMKNVTMRAQLEGALLSTSLIMSSITLMAFYLMLFAEGSGAYKTLIFINLVCAFLFISSNLVTTYQQYVSHMEMMGYDPVKERQEIRARGHLFKRIALAYRERKKVKAREKYERENPLNLKAPLLMEDSMDSMIKVNNDMNEAMNKLNLEADKLRKASKQSDSEKK